jgi:hypothetical protein
MAATKWRRTLGGLVAATLMVGALAACGDDDGGDVRDTGSGSGSGPGSGSGSGSGSASE